MAPSWFTKTSNSNRANSNSSAAQHSAPRDRPLPSLPPVHQTPSAHDQSSTPLRPRTAGPTPTHSHTRSASQPIVKPFSRKKSTGNLNRNTNDPNLDLDEALVPVLDGSPVDKSFSGPSRLPSGKRTGSDNVDNRVQRRCVCCDSRVKVPKELDKFRCMCCLTINDLKPLAPQKQDGHANDKHGKRPQDAPVHTGPAAPLSVERTYAMIERCLMSYLESRSRRISPSGISPSGHTRTTSDGAPREQVNRPGPCASQLNPPVYNNGMIHASPPSTPTLQLQAGSAGPPAETTKTTSRSGTFPIEGEQPLIARKPVSGSVRRPPPPPLGMELRPRTSTQNLRPVLTKTLSHEGRPKPPPSPRMTTEIMNERKRYDRVKMIFRQLEDYIVSTYGETPVLNASFSTVRPAPTGRARSESHITTPPPELVNSDIYSHGVSLDELDAKTLLLGDIGENGSWWTNTVDGQQSGRIPRKKVGSESRKPVSSKSPNINWTQLAAWYNAVHTAGIDWQRQLDILRDSSFRTLEDVDGAANIKEIEQDLAEAREHTIRTLVKVTENVLKRPGRPLQQPEHLRFLLIILANPILYPNAKLRQSTARSTKSPSDLLVPQDLSTSRSPEQRTSPRKRPSRVELQHTGIIKRAFGLLGNTTDACHRYVIGWLSRLDEEHFTSLVDLCSIFITHRLSRQSSRPSHAGQFADGGLIPDLSGGAMSTSAQLHSAMGLSGSMKKRVDGSDDTDWANDWQTRAAAKVMSLLFAANGIWQGKRKDDVAPGVDSASSVREGRPGSARNRATQLLPTSTFYNTLLDFQDLIADFRAWESKKERFAFCQYPFFLSMGAKIKILEYDARRQMEVKAREAIFDQVMRSHAIDSQFHLRVRRECMIDDSLRQISEAVGSGQEELKKGLRVHFEGEEGVDAGGLRKEWFLMLAREVFDADHGLFVYDEQSRTCYFNPHTFETSDQFYLVGALLGLAIYNSIILDIALPSFAFRKLMAAAPASTISGPAGTSGHPGLRSQISYTLADLAEYKPELAQGLQKLLDFDGDVESTYCWSFVVPVDKYGVVTEVPLIKDGERTPVTNDNRVEFVDAYVRYLLDTAVARQFEPFKRGFFTVCAGNALSLFRAEEIELLIRGSDETLDVRSLKAVAVYENWRENGNPNIAVVDPVENVPVLQWFWQAFESAAPQQQRKLLAFITSSDRIPAVGATSLVLRIVAGAKTTNDSEHQRFPVARTCFNMLVLWRYQSKEQLEQRLWRAVEDSEGFGLK